MRSSCIAIGAAATGAANPGLQPGLETPLVAVELPARKVNNLLGV